MVVAKFDEGDKVVPNKRTPKWILELIRPSRKRTIVFIFYDAARKCRYFYLGSNNQGKYDGFVSAYPFRSYQLDKPIARGVGRPRAKRTYQKQVENGDIKPLGRAEQGLVSHLRA